MKSIAILAVVAAFAGVADLRAEIIINGGPAPDVLTVKKVVPKALRGAEGDEAEKPADSGPQFDTVRFFNGDSLRGTLMSVDKGTLSWKSPEAKGDNEFQLKNLGRVALAKGKTGTNNADACLVKLVNGDELLGDLKSLDADKLTLQTWYAGALTVERKKIASLRMVKSSTGAIYEGPTGLEGWETGRLNRKASWRFENGAFSTSKPSTIGRDVKLPAMSHIEFDVAWRNSLQLVLNMYTDGLEEYYNNNAYMLQFNSGYLYMQRMRKNGGSSNMGNVEVQSLQTKNKVHVDVYCNKEAKTIALMLDGALVKTWKENGEWAGMGTGILFYQQGVGYAKVSGIKITEWDGKLEERSGPSGKSKDDAAELANRDKISGTLKGIKDGKMSFETAFATMDVPLDKVVTLDLASEKADKMEKKAGDIRAVFAGRGAVTFELEKWEGAHVTGMSPAFGKAKFDTSAFSQVLFNLEQQKKNEGEAEAGEDDGQGDQ